MTKRFIWADIIRILAIYFIVVLHVATGPSAQNANFMFFVANTIIHTCVPLLVMLSGALLLSKKESYTIFFRKRVSRVLIPWISWTIIFTSITVISQSSYKLVTVANVFHLIFVPFFWFIILICALYLLTPSLRIFILNAKSKDILTVIILWFLAVCLLPYIRDTQAFPLNVDNGIVRLVIDFIGYYLLGGLLTKIKLQKKVFIYTPFIFIIGILGTSWLGYFFARNSHLSSIDIFAYISPGIVIVTVSLFLLIYYAEMYFQRKFNLTTVKILGSISKATLGIYFIHYLFLNRDPLPHFIKTTSLVTISYNVDLFINGVIFFLICFSLIFLLQKMPLVKHLIA